MQSSLKADYFDGHTARAQPATVHHAGDELVIDFDGGQRRVPLTQVQWPERQRHGARIAHLSADSGGGSLHSDDAAAWDAFVRGLPRAGDGLVVRAQQSWRAVLIAVALLVALGFAGYRWGVPLAARGVVAALPLEADEAVGRIALQSVEARWLKPSELPAEDQKRIAAAFKRMVEAAFPDAATRPAYQLLFHAGTIGPNAFALPGGTIVLTDELVKLLPDRDDTVLGVLAHELGHVRARHGMRLVVQVSLLGAATSAALGDFSAVLASVPALVGQMAYSRDAEREADAESVRMMQAAGISPKAMVAFFERVREWRESEEGRRRGADIDVGIAFSSHPADEERISFFRNAGR